MKTRFALWAMVLLVFANVSAPAATLYVDLNSTNSVPPYVDWSTAATNIQDAIDASYDGDLILVTNGIYRTGGRVVYGLLTNRIVVNKAVSVQSVNGPDCYNYSRLRSACHNKRRQRVALCLSDK